MASSKATQLAIPGTDEASSQHRQRGDTQHRECERRLAHLSGKTEAQEPLLLPLHQCLEQRDTSIRLALQSWREF